MMVEFLPNLDDGELWIPSDILLADDPSPATPPPYPTTTDFDLAGHFAALSLLNRPSQAANQYALTASPTRSPTRPTTFWSGLPYFYANPILQPGQPRQTGFIVQNDVSRPIQPRKCGGTGVFLPRAAFYGVRRKRGPGNRNLRRMNQKERNEQGRRSYQPSGPVAACQRE